MLKVNNKKTIYKLAMRNLKAYKMRTIFTLITITLSISLLAVSAFLLSAIKVEKTKAVAKMQHVIYSNLTIEQVNGLKQNENISDMREFKRGNSFEVDDYVILPYYMEEKVSAIENVVAEDGHYPTDINEVLVHETLLNKMGIENNIGEELTIDFLDGTTETFIVSGTYSDSHNKDFFPIYLSKEYADNGSQLKDISYSLAARISHATKMNEPEFKDMIINIGKANNVARQYINENNKFVDTITFDMADFSSLVLIGLAVLTVSILVIYSIFYISISERTRQFGQLKTIGTTQKQIKRMIKLEGIILSVIGSVVGIAIGTLIAYSIRPNGFSVMDFSTLSAIIIVANIITVIISISKPAKIAASISPIEASKFSGYESKQAKKNIKQLKRNLSPLSISLIWTKGNRKKSFMTILSLALAGITFMCATTFVSSINEEKYLRQMWFRFGDYTFELSSNAIQINEFGQTGVQLNNPLNQEIINQITDIDGVKNVDVFKSLGVSYVHNETNLEDRVGAFTKEQSEAISQYVTEGSFDYDSMIKNKELIVTANDIVEEIFGWKFKIGDKIKFKWYNGEEYMEDYFTVVAEVPETSKVDNLEIKSRVYNAGWFLAPQELLSGMMIPEFNLNNRIVLSAEDYSTQADVILSELATIDDNNTQITLDDFESAASGFIASFNMIYFTIMGAALFFIAFSLISLVNTLISNIMARKREFAMLSAIGLSKKQLKTIILGEGMYLSIINILLSTLIGIPIGYAIVKLANMSGMDYMQYQFPLVYIIGYILVGLIIPTILCITISKIMDKDSLVERLRDVE